MSAATLEIWLVDLAAAEPALEAVEARSPRLSAEDHERIARLTAIAARRERRLSTIALRIAIARAAGDGRFDRQPFARNELGKPQLEGAALAFNASHAGGFALLAVARDADARLGVDIEAERDLRMSEDRKRRVAAAAAQLLRGDDVVTAQELTPARVLQAWVRIEAVAKATGLGLARVLTHFGIIGRSDDDHGSARVAVCNPANDPLTSALEGLTLRDLDLAALAHRPVFAAIAAPRGLLERRVRTQLFPAATDEIANLLG